MRLSGVSSRGISRSSCAKCGISCKTGRRGFYPALQQGCVVPHNDGYAPSIPLCAIYGIYRSVLAVCTGRALYEEICRDQATSRACTTSGSFRLNIQSNGPIARSSSSESSSRSSRTTEPSPRTSPGMTRSESASLTSFIPAGVRRSTFIAVSAETEPGARPAVPTRE